MGRVLSPHNTGRCRSPTNKPQQLRQQMMDQNNNTAAIYHRKAPIGAIMDRPKGAKYKDYRSLPPNQPMTSSEFRQID